MVERGQIDTPIAHTYITAHFPCLVQELQLKYSEINKFFGPKAPLLEQSCCYAMDNDIIQTYTYTVLSIHMGC